MSYDAVQLPASFNADKLLRQNVECQRPERAGGLETAGVMASQSSQRAVGCHF